MLRLAPNASHGRRLSSGDKMSPPITLIEGIRPYALYHQRPSRALADLLARAHMIHSQAGNGLGVSAGMLEDVPICVRAG